MNLPKTSQLFLAKLDDLPVNADAPVARLPGLYMTDVLMIIAAGVILMTALLGWVIFIRGPKQQGSARRIYKSRSEEGEDSSESNGKRGKRRHKRRRREHRGRNPTLAETGGLPPSRNQTSTGNSSSSHAS